MKEDLPKILKRPGQYVIVLLTIRSCRLSQTHMSFVTLSMEPTYESGRRSTCSIYVFF